MRNILFPLALAALLLPACMKVSGVVEQSPGRPLRSAVLSVGRPDGIAVYATHHVDPRGRFSFQLGMADESNLYVYDAAGNPRMTLRRIDRHEIGENMHILLQPANPRTEPDLTAP